MLPKMDEPIYFLILKKVEVLDTDTTQGRIDSRGSIILIK